MKRGRGGACILVKDILKIYIISTPQMKYLAAYSLLALSGKKDICRVEVIQLLPTSRPCWAASPPPPTTKTSTRSSVCSRASPSTNSSPQGRAVLVLPPPSHLPLLPPLLPALPPRNSSPSPRRRSPSLPRRRMTLTSETCSADQWHSSTHHHHLFNSAPS